MYLHIYDDDADYSPESFIKKREIISFPDFQLNDSFAVSEPGDEPGDESDDGIENKKLRGEIHIPE